MKVIKPLSLGKYLYFDVEVSLKKGEKKIAVEIDDGEEKRELTIDVEEHELKFVNFSCMRYVILTGMFLFLGVVSLNFAGHVRSLWEGSMQPGVKCFLNFVILACAFVLGFTLIAFWAPLTRFRGFLIINPRERIGENGSVKEGYVIGMETTSELNRINKIFALFNKTEKEKEKVEVKKEKKQKRRGTFWKKEKESSLF